MTSMQHSWEQSRNDVPGTRLEYHKTQLFATVDRPHLRSACHIFAMRSLIRTVLAAAAVSTVSGETCSRNVWAVGTLQRVRNLGIHRECIAK